MSRKTLVMVLAGGKGSRLAPLTCHRAKPAVPFGGRYRIIDFVLSNIGNSGYRSVYVLTQYMATSLIRHLTRNWHASSGDGFIEVVPAQMRDGDRWYQGTADSVWQNLNLIQDFHAENVAVFGGDHIYKFDLSQMEDFHVASAADLTIAAYPVQRHEASSFGVFEVDASGNLLGFEEKPADPKAMPGQSDQSLVSMGNYLIRASALEEALSADARDTSSSHDFGRDVIPRMLKGGYKVAIYDFAKNTIAGEPEGAVPYWRDVGTLDSYFDSNMDLREPIPRLNLYNFRWRIRTAQRNFPPARFSAEAGVARDVVDSLVCEGTIVASATMRRVVSGYDCYFHRGSIVEDAVILSGCDIGAGARLRGVLFDKNCAIEPGAVIGEDAEADRERFPIITPRGRVALPKGTVVPRKGPIQLTHDIESALLNDSATASRMKEFAGRYEVSGRTRHSHDSVGPRFRKFGVLSE